MALAYGVSTAQTPTYTPMKSFYEFKGIKMDSLFLLPAFADTTSANTGRIKSIVGSVINVGGSIYERRNNKWNQVGQQVQDTLIDITYSNLVSTINANLLKEKSYYKITDFRTTYTIYGTLVDTIGEIEPLVVFATSDSTISANAYSLTYPNDVINYSIYDTTVLKPSSGTRGSILYRHDMITNLSAYYDWRNVVWKRFALNPAPSLYYAFNSYDGIPDYTYTKTFGNNCKNITLGPDTWNVTIFDGCYAIKLIGNTGSVGAGVTILNNAHDITIDENCCKVATTGSGYIGGIFIGGSNAYINIGKRSYNISIGSGCYAIDLGLQQSDVSIPAGSYRRRLEKGFSNFEATTSISSKQINVYSVIVQSYSSYLYNAAIYCGILNITSSNAIDTLQTLTALITSVTFQDIEIRPISNQKILIRDITNGGNFYLGGEDLLIDGAKGEYAIFFKRMVDGLGTQPSNFYLKSTNKKVSLADAPNFANTDLTATGNRVHNFQYNNLTIDTMFNMVLRTIGGTARQTAQLTTTGGSLSSYKYSDGSTYGLNFSSSSNNVYLLNKSNQAHVSKRNFGIDTIALISDIKPDNPQRINGTATGNVYANMASQDLSIYNANILELKAGDGSFGSYSPDFRLEPSGQSYFRVYNNNVDSINGLYIDKAGLELKSEDNLNGNITSITMDGTTITTDGIELNINSDTLDIKSNVIKGDFSADRPFGSATLSGGSVTVNNATVTSDSKIMLTYQNCVGCDTIYIDAINAGTSFDIKSTSGSDDSEVFYMIINP
jgi:hypothetical protein